MPVLYHKLNILGKQKTLHLFGSVFFLIRFDVVLLDQIFDDFARQN